MLSNGNRTEWSPNRSVIIQMMAKSDDRAAGDRFVYHEYDYRPNWTTRSLITFNHKNDNFREKKNSQVMKERENLHLNTDKGRVNILRPPRLLPAIWRQKHKSKRGRTRNFNFECDWLIELSDNKLSNNKLCDNSLASKLVENNHNRRNCNFHD